MGKLPQGMKAFGIVLLLACAAVNAQPTRSDSIVGCYAVTFRGEGGQKVEKFAITSTPTGDFRMASIEDPKEDTGFRFKRATSEQLQAVRQQAAFFDVQDGIATQIEGDPKPWLIGLFRGRDRNGKELILFLGGIAHGAAVKVSCP